MSRALLLACLVLAYDKDQHVPRSGALGQSFGRIHLCVFIPITHRSHKDAQLSTLAVQSWASEGLQREAGAHVRFISLASTAGTLLEPHTMYVPGDMDTDYMHLPMRIMKMWEYLGQRLADECDWYMKADPDSYVNLRAVSDRLSCFDAAQEHFLGVVHAAVPPRHMNWPALYFGHGGSGYVISRGLIPGVGRIAGPCLDDMIETTQGMAMEDVMFALCLKKKLKIEVQSYGYLLPSGPAVRRRIKEEEQEESFDEPRSADAQEFVVNFHQARDQLFESARTGLPLERMVFWDAQPPRLHGCIMVAHPVENASDLQQVHAIVSAHEAPKARGQKRRSARSSCVPSPIDLAEQAEVQLSAPGTTRKAFWSEAQLSSIARCFASAEGASPRCSWEATTDQCYGLRHFAPAKSSGDCATACCRSGMACRMFQFREDQGCWISDMDSCIVMEQVAEESLRWQGGVKVAG
eukprot:TRINITY_DN1290_c0_g2_i1.p1 TRINITY_DN1290_c0_g2~~TRINITY_DN1290_c0_g2_i1.p1  ORF type:complete len:465 (-),score=78.58 TRINITY_DN1290_c0_g2_i1:47-1441(-)